MTTVEQAESTQSALRKKLDDARLQLEALDECRKEIAFEAHTGDAKAEKRLAEMNRDRLALHGQIETLEEAHLEASRRVADAERAEELEQDAVRGRRAKEIAAELLKLARRIDAALAQVVKDSNQLDTLIAELNFDCKCPSPNHAQLESLGTRALKSALMQSRFKIEHLAPHERRTFATLFGDYAQSIARWAEGRIPEKEAAE